MTDELQEKIDKIDILESQLEKEKNSLSETQKQVADIKEELQIIEQRYQMIVQEKANALKSLKETQQELLNQKETLGELRDKNEQLIEQVKIGQTENNYLKKNYERQVNKLKQVQENNILIPKRKEEPIAMLNESVIKEEDTLVTRLQQEVRVLHHRLL